ncbi:pre T-cell antigen receptor alpha-like [Tachysurus ichikawai]
MLCSLLTILLFTMDNMADVKAAPFSTSPFFHIPLDHGGLTILVCVVNDVLNRDGGMHWLSKRTSRLNPALYNALGKENAQDIVSLQSPVSMEWDTHTCFISHRSMIRFKVGHNYGLQKSRKGFDHDNMEHTCPENQIFNAVQEHTALLVIHFLRIILVKITVFNVLMTAKAVIKW